MRAHAPRAVARPGRGARRREGPARALVRPRHGQVPRRRARSPTCSTFNALSALPGRNFGTETTALALEDRAAVRDLVRLVLDRLRADPQDASDGGSARVEYESAFALGPLVGIDDPDAVLAAVRPLRRARRSTRSPPAARSPGRWTAGWSRPGCASATPRACSARSSEIGAREGLGDLLAEGSRARLAARWRSEDCAMHVKGLELPGYEPRTLHAMALGLAVNARGADHNRSGAYEADLSGELDRLDGGARARRGGDRDRGPRGGDGLADPLQVPARRLRRPVGGVGGAAAARHRLGRSTARELHETARGIVGAKHAFNRREGWTRAEDTLPPRLLDVPLTLPSGREAVLTRERLDGMVDAYHRARGTGQIRSQTGDAAACHGPDRPTQDRRADASRARSTGRGDRPGRARRSTPPPSRSGIDIPVLCHDERYDPVGVCRMCAVDIGGRVLAAACVRPCEDGMEVKTATPKVERQRAMLTELLMADQPPTRRGPQGDDHRRQPAALARPPLRRRARRAAAAGRAGAAIDDSNPVIHVDHDACILCDRCVRACDDIQGNDVIGRSGKGYATRIAFDLNDPMGESTCVTCGECVAACPTGALTNKPIRDVPIRPRDRAQVGRLRLPVLRRRLRAHLPRGRGAQRDRLRRGPRPARQPAARCASRAATAGTTPRPPSA